MLLYMKTKYVNAGFDLALDKHADHLAMAAAQVVGRRSGWSVC